MGTPILTVYDANGKPYAIPAIKGERGERGESVLGVGNTDIQVSTLNPGSDATAGLTVDGPVDNRNFHFNFGIPRGATGAKGDKGDKGDTGDAGKSAYVGENGNWWVGDVDTGVIANHAKNIFGSYDGSGANGISNNAFDGKTWTFEGELLYFKLYGMITNASNPDYANEHQNETRYQTSIENPNINMVPYTDLVFSSYAYNATPKYSHPTAPDFTGIWCGTYVYSGVGGYSSMWSYLYDEPTNMSVLRYIWSNGSNGYYNIDITGITYLYQALVK